jgi:hypothetical protein
VVVIVRVRLLSLAVAALAAVRLGSLPFDPPLESQPTIPTIAMTATSAGSRKPRLRGGGLRRGWV